MITRLLLPAILSLVALSSRGQSYYINCGVLENSAILKVSASYPNQIWLISSEDDSGKFYLVDEDKIVHDFTDIIRAKTASKLTTVTAVGYDTCFIGTASDYVFYLHGTSLTHLNQNAGLAESHIVSMVDANNGTCYLSTTHKGYYCNYWFEHFTLINTHDHPVFYQPEGEYLKEYTEVRINNGHRVAKIYTNNTIYEFDTQDSLGVLTSLFVYDYYSTSNTPYWYIGSTDGILIKTAFNSIKYRSLQGLTVNDIIRYHETTMIATNNGLYHVGDYTPDSVKLIPFDLPVTAFNDLEIYGDFLLAATDHGLLWITDSAQCENLPPDFSSTVDTVQFPDDTTVQFLSCGTYDSYYWDFGDGTSDSISSPVHNYDVAGVYYVCLTVANFCGTGTYCRDIALFNTGIQHVAMNQNAYYFYPNPFDDQTTLLGNLSAFSPLQIELFDLPGNHLTTITTSSIVDDKLSPGIYFYRVKSGNRLLAAGKLIKN